MITASVELQRNTNRICIKLTEATAFLNKYITPSEELYKLREMLQVIYMLLQGQWSKLHVLSFVQYMCVEI